MDKFAHVKLFNQKVWNALPERALETTLDAIDHGGFKEDCISREVGNYEGQLMAIRRGWVSWDKNKFRWMLNKAGEEALIANGREVPINLPVRDGWHDYDTRFIAQTKIKNGKPYLVISKEVIGYAESLAMHPMYSVEQAIELRDYISSWIESHKDAVA